MIGQENAERIWKKIQDQKGRDLKGKTILIQPLLGGGNGDKKNISRQNAGIQ